MGTFYGMADPTSRGISTSERIYGFVPTPPGEGSGDPESAGERGERPIRRGRRDCRLCPLRPVNAKFMFLSDAAIRPCVGSDQGIVRRRPMTFGTSGSLFAAAALER